MATLYSGKRKLDAQDADPDVSDDLPEHVGATTMVRNVRQFLRVAKRALVAEDNVTGDPATDFSNIARLAGLAMLNSTQHDLSREVSRVGYSIEELDKTVFDIKEAMSTAAEGLEASMQRLSECVGGLYEPINEISTTLQQAE